MNKPDTGDQERENKNTVPQENPETGISLDYLNEVFCFRDALMSGKTLLEILSNRKNLSFQDTWTGKQRDYKIWTYFERLANPEHGLTKADLINERSRDRIPLLDAQVAIMNEEIASPNPDETKFRNAWNEFYFLVTNNRKCQI